MYDAQDTIPTYLDYVVIDDLDEVLALTRQGWHILAAAVGDAYAYPQYILVK